MLLCWAESINRKTTKYSLFNKNYLIATQWCMFCSLIWHTSCMARGSWLRAEDFGVCTQRQRKSARSGACALVQGAGLCGVFVCLCAQ